MRKFRSIPDAFYYGIGELYDLLDRTRLDEVGFIAAVIATAAYLLSGISFYTVFIALTCLQLLCQGFDVNKARAEFRWLMGERDGKGGDAPADKRTA